MTLPPTVRYLPGAPSPPICLGFEPAHDPRLQSVMIEVEKSLYLDEARGFRADRRRAGWTLVQRMLAEAALWLRNGLS